MNFLQGLKGIGIWMVKAQSPYNTSLLRSFLVWRSRKRWQLAHPLLNSPRAEPVLLSSLPCLTFFTEMVFPWGRSSGLCFASSAVQSLEAVVAVKVPLCFQRCLFCLDERLETFVNCECFHTGQEKHFLASLKYTLRLGVNSDSRIL